MSTAYASGYKVNEQSASGVGTAYAGRAAVADDASVVFYNPAAMS
ncbi:MAG: outer membrane protein transport protein, partial [Thalassolituus oleivorans]|nr:outer membrane protein transport protein [Thalassolituus oleivorans]